MTVAKTIRVELGERSYPIRIGIDWMADLGGAIAEAVPGRGAIVVTEPGVARLWGDPVMASLKAAGFDAEMCAIPGGEEAKAFEAVVRILDFALERRADRETVIVALGGGVVGDIAGFAAGILLRGVPLVQIPTSLLAMVDSSVGGKTGVNHAMGKNLIGVFKQPSLVAVDLKFLESLPAVEMRSGLAEVIKYGMIADAEFFGYLESHRDDLLAGEEAAVVRAIARSCQIKAEVVSRDEREAGLRAILNFGHTFGHAIEAVAGYGEVRHGEAVAMGMMAACRLGEAVGGFPPEATGRLERLLEGVGLPARIPRMDAARLIAAMQSDKKARSGRVRFVVPVRIGEVALRDDIEEAAIERALHQTMTESQEA